MVSCVQMVLQISRFKLQVPQSRVICGHANFRQANSGVRSSSLYISRNITIFPIVRPHMISALWAINHFVDYCAHDDLNEWMQTFHKSAYVPLAIRAMIVGYSQNVTINEPLRYSQ